MQINTVASAPGRRRPRAETKPLTVSIPRARQILDVGNTKFWELVKADKIKLVEVGRSRMVQYASLEALANPDA
jgi:hypothetical protein